MAVNDIYQAVLDYETDAIAGMMEKELAAGTDVIKLLQEGLIAAMDTVGQAFTEEKLFVPEMLMAAKTMKAGLEVLKPRLKGDETSRAGVIVLGTVKGDLHDIGKNLVGIMLEGGGFEVHDIGIDVMPETFVAAVKEHKADILALSALLTTTMPAMKETVNVVKGAGLPVKIIVGGAPVSQNYADTIGADGYSEDAPGAVALARSLV